MASTHPEAGQQAVIESSEPEVARTLFAVARLLGATRVAEVGVFRGYTTQFLAAALAPNAGTLHLIDAHEPALTEAADAQAGMPTAGSSATMASPPTQRSSLPSQTRVISCFSMPTIRRPEWRRN